MWITFYFLFCLHNQYLFLPLCCQNNNPLAPQPMARLETLIANIPPRNLFIDRIPIYILAADRACDELKVLTEGLSKSQIKTLKARFKQFTYDPMFDLRDDPFETCHLICADFTDWISYRYYITRSDKYEKSYLLQNKLFGLSYSFLREPSKPERYFGKYFKNDNPIPLAYILLRLTILYGYIISRRECY